MNDSTTNWTKEELKIYILIYCANADYFESISEVNYIKSKIQDSDFDNIYAEFKKDNNYIRIQKINHAIERLGYTKNEKDLLFEEMRELFLSDGKYHSLEQKLHSALSNIIH